MAFANMHRHASLVSSLAGRITSLYKQGIPYRISHGSTNSTRPRHAGVETLDISALNSVLSIDSATRTALVEPNVPMDALITETLHHKLVPPVVMEFPGITAGGGFAGTAGESSSFRHGFWDDIVTGAEIVLGDGTAVWARNPDYPASESEPPDGLSSASSESYGDLFRGAAGAVGTLGVTTLLKVRLEPARRFVRTRYLRSDSIPDTIATVRKLADPNVPPASKIKEVGVSVESGAGPDFVDGILFSKDHGVTIAGYLTDDLPEGRQATTFSRPQDEWFYLHARDVTSTPMHIPTSPFSEAAEDYVPLSEYLFRYDRGGFWVGRQGFRYFYNFPFTRLTRRLLDDFLHTRMMYKALHGSGESKRMIVQDLALPYATAEEFLRFTGSAEFVPAGESGRAQDEVGIWPVWLCPLRARASPTWHPHASCTYGSQHQPEQMLNLGVWGMGPGRVSDFIAANRRLETQLRECGGMKWLYAHTYYTEDEFWAEGVYDREREWYFKLREKYRANTLPTVWDKVSIRMRNEKDEKEPDPWEKLWRKRPLGGVRGLKEAIKSKEYMKSRNKPWAWVA